jgi:hypothetical protein
VKFVWNTYSLTCSITSRRIICVCFFSSWVVRSPLVYIGFTSDSAIVFVFQHGMRTRTSFGIIQKCDLSQSKCSTPVPAAALLSRSS